MYRSFLPAGELKDVWKTGTIITHMKAKKLNVTGKLIPK